MLLTEAVKKSLSDCVLCWLATFDGDFPSVSPKEIFTFYKDKIIIANIASPQSKKNINQHPKACVSFVDVLIQKGWKVKGDAKVIDEGHASYAIYKGILEEMTKGLFPFHTVFEITPVSIKEILSPSYILYPEVTSEISQKESAKRIYGLK